MDLGLSGDVSSKGVNVAVTGNAEFPHVVNRNAVLRHYMSNGIQDDDELHAFISEGLGYTIPRERFCKDEGHCAPFDFIADLFFERVETAIGFANRTGGKTLNVSIVNFCNSIFNFIQWMKARSYCHIHYIICIFWLRTTIKRTGRKYFPK